MKILLKMISVVAASTIISMSLYAEENKTPVTTKDICTMKAQMEKLIHKEDEDQRAREVFFAIELKKAYLNNDKELLNELIKKFSPKMSPEDVEKLISLIANAVVPSVADYRKNMQGKNIGDSLAVSKALEGSAEAYESLNLKLNGNANKAFKDIKVAVNNAYYFFEVSKVTTMDFTQRNYYYNGQILYDPTEAIIIYWVFKTGKPIIFKPSNDPALKKALKDSEYLVFLGRQFVFDLFLNNNTTDELIVETANLMADTARINVESAKEVGTVMKQKQILVQKMVSKMNSSFDNIFAERGGFALSNITKVEKDAVILLKDMGFSDAEFNELIQKNRAEAFKFLYLSLRFLKFGDSSSYFLDVKKKIFADDYEAFKKCK